MGWLLIDPRLHATSEGFRRPAGRCAARRMGTETFNLVVIGEEPIELYKRESVAHVGTG